MQGNFDLNVLFSKAASIIRISNITQRHIIPCNFDHYISPRLRKWPCVQTSEEATHNSIFDFWSSIATQNSRIFNHTKRKRSFNRAI